MAIVTTQLELFRILKQKLGEQESEILVKFIQENTENEMLKAKHDLVTRKDLERTETKFIWIISGLVALATFFYYNLDKRMDKLDTRMDRLEQKMDAQYKELNDKMDAQYKELNDKMDRQFELLTQRMDQMMLMIQNISNKK